MGRGKSSVSSRLLEFPHDNVASDHSRKSTIARHSTSQAHKEKAETSSGEPARKRQLMITETLPNKDVSEKKMHKDLVEAFVVMNIPLPLLDHPLVISFLTTYVKRRSTVPTSSWFRRDMIPNMFEKVKQAVAEDP